MNFNELYNVWNNCAESCLDLAPSLYTRSQLLDPEFPRIPESHRI